MDGTKIISIILPNFNGGNNLRESIESFTNQKSDSCELIIVDSKSSDNSHQIIEEFTKKYPSIRWIKETDSGISDAINIGLRHAKGSYIGYLGSDDRLVADILGVVISYTKLVDADSFYFDSYFYNPFEKLCQYRRCPALEFTRENLYKYGTIVGLQNIFLHKRIFANYKFNSNNKYSMDYELFLEMTTHAGVHMYIPQPSSINLFGGNISQHLKEQQFYESIQVSLRNAKTKKEKYYTFLRFIKVHPRIKFFWPIRRFCVRIFNKTSYQQSLKNKL